PHVQHGHRSDSRRLRGRRGCRHRRASRGGRVGRARHRHDRIRRRRTSSGRPLRGLISRCRSSPGESHQDRSSPTSALRPSPCWGPAWWRAGGSLLALPPLPMPPLVLGAAALCAGAWGFFAFREPQGAASGSPALFIAVVVCALGYLLWLASPALLPITDGPDVVHHLQLIHLIQRTHRLPHDPALAPYLAEMMNYTPGGHILAATVAGWLRIDALRVVFPVTALFVAIKFGIVYALAVRVIGDRPGAAWQALSAPVLLLVPAVYTFGSFFRFYFYAQVVSETFVMAMALGAVGWMRT